VADTADAVAAEAPVLGAAAPDTAAAEAPVLGAATPDAAAVVAPETSAAAASTTATEAPMPAPEAATSSSGPVVEEELEVVFGRQFLQLQPLEEEATPLPQVLVRIRQSIEEATSTAEAAFRREWAALESERQRLSDWHTRLEGCTKAEASNVARVRSELKADLESYRANLRKVFDREVEVASREKALALREEAFAKGGGQPRGSVVRA